MSREHKSSDSLIMQTTLFRKFALYLAGTVLFLGCLSASALADDKGGVHILLFGDSIAAGFGLAPDDALAGQLETRLTQTGGAVSVRNGGVSGDTTAGGLARIDWTVSGTGTEGTRDLVIIVLGGNDAMRGLTPAQSEANLERIVARFKASGFEVLLTGMRAPPNLGTDYAAAFEPMYARIAAKHSVVLYPFILEGVAANPVLNQADGIHPNAEGVAIIVTGLAPVIERLLGAPQGS